MAWTPPKTWCDYDRVTAAAMNEQFRDNLEYLRERLDEKSPAPASMTTAVAGAALAVAAANKPITRRGLLTFGFTRRIDLD